MGRGPFIRATSWILALHMALAPSVWAGGGKVAVLAPSPMTPSAEASWSEAVGILRRDPAVLLLDEQILQERIGMWRSQEAAADRARMEAAQAWSGEIGSALSSAWEDYYGFSYEAALARLREAATLLPRLPESNSQAEFLYEISLLEGMCLIASGRKDAGAAFAQAAALRPGVDLSEVRFSPAVRDQFNLVRTMALEQGRSRLSVSGRPGGATVLLDGREMGRLPFEQAQVLPGKHFLEVRSEGRRTFLQELDLLPHGEFQVNAQLEVIPAAGDLGGVYARRFLEGERDALAVLLRKMGVDYLVLGQEKEGRLEAWLLDSSGQAVSSAVVADARQDGGADVSNLAGMARDHAAADLKESLSMVYTALPEMPVPSAQEPTRRSRWQLAATGLVLLFLAVSASGGQDEGGTRVDVSW